MPEGYRVAVVGATGQVGTLMLRLLRERDFPASEIVPFASARSAGRELDGGPPCAASTTTRSRASTWRCSRPAARPPASGRRASPHAGAAVIDNSSRWRMERDVPLVVSEVNPEALAGHAGSSPTPTARRCRWSSRSKPLHDEAGIERLVISTYQAVSGTGTRWPSRSCSTSRVRCCTSAPSTPPRSTRTRSPSTRSPMPAASPPATTTPTRSAS